MAIGLVLIIFYILLIVNILISNSIKLIVYLVTIKKIIKKHMSLVNFDMNV